MKKTIEEITPYNNEDFLNESDSHLSHCRFTEIELISSWEHRYFIWFDNLTVPKDFYIALIAIDYASSIGIEVPEDEYDENGDIVECYCYEQHVHYSEDKGLSGSNGNDDIIMEQNSDQWEKSNIMFVPIEFIKNYKK